MSSTSKTFEIISDNASFNVDESVASRYGAAAVSREASLCCPIGYDPTLLEKLPQEIIEKDYGCGDPTPFVNPGDTVVDLGSGGGKLCYMTSQLVGKEGRVIGVDCNQKMLNLARKYQAEMAEKLGYANVGFHYGRIQDLALDLDRFHERLAELDSNDVEHPVQVLNLMRTMRADQPMIPSDSVDCVISNCVLNLVNPDDRKQLFAELYRVLRKGGRAAISDIVCDEDVPLEMQQDGQLWSGCLSGAWREDRFIDEFVNAGFYGAEFAKYQSEPWQTINGIEFRSVTVVAHKGKEGVCLERNQAVIYKGPFEQVMDDDGHVYPRGQRIAVCDKTFQILMGGPYRGQFLPVEPIEEIALDDAQLFDCDVVRRRDPRETKGESYNDTKVSDASVCDSGSGCC